MPLIFTDDFLRGVLQQAKNIVVVGASPKGTRSSYFVMRYLLAKGFGITPINPRHAGEEILGRKVYGSLAEVPHSYEMVDVFRASEAVPELVEEILAVKEEKGIHTVWLQFGVVHEEAAAKAQAHGLQVVMDRCTKVEYARLWGELGWGGFATGVVSGRRPKLTRDFSKKAH